MKRDCARQCIPEYQLLTHVFLGLAHVAERFLKLSMLARNNQDGHVGLRCPRDHVRDEVAMSGSIQQRDATIWSLEVCDSDIDRDPTLSFRFVLVHDPRKRERALARVLGLLLELLQLLPRHVIESQEQVSLLYTTPAGIGVNRRKKMQHQCTHMDTSAAWTQTTHHQGTLAGIDMADDDHV